LCRHLREAGFAAHVVAPSRTPTASGRRTKCDRRDSELLAFLLAKAMLSPVHVPTLQEEADRQLVRRREQVMGWVRRIKSQIKSLLLQHGVAEPAGLTHWSRASVQALRDLPLAQELRWVLDSLLDELASAEAQRDRLTRQVGDLADTPRHAPAVALLRRVPGVGLVTAMTVRTELPRPARFRRPTHLSSYLGLAPLVRQSGETRHTGPIVKAGNRRLRTILIEAAWQWIRYDPAARARYEHLKGNTQSGYKAIAGVARRLGILLWRILTTGEVYPPPAPEPTREGDAS
jgi:transposase